MFFDRAEIGFGEQKVVALPFPGHTPGSYLFVFDGVLFVSDSIQISDGKLDFAMRAVLRRHGGEQAVGAPASRRRCRASRST